MSSACPWAAMLKAMPESPPEMSGGLPEPMAERSFCM
jgi:hypothetical protein